METLKTEVNSEKPHKTKSERRQEKYLKMKEFRKVKRKLNRQNKKLNPVDVANTDITISRKVIAKNGIKMSDSKCKVKVAVDCSFDDLMSIKDVAKLQNQISNSYGLNRRSQTPLQFFITSFNNKLEDKFEHTGNPVGEYKSWDVNFHKEHFEELCNKDDIVYLCAESENVLEDFSDSKMYIIGGLVDHNHHKSLCYKQACEKGYQTARLPIAEHLKLNSRAILTVYHVFEIILRRCEGLGWEESLKLSIPQRKIAEISEKVDEVLD